MEDSKLPMWDITLTDGVKCGSTFARFETREDAERWARRAWGHHFKGELMVVAKEAEECGDGFDAENA